MSPSQLMVEVKSAGACARSRLKVADVATTGSSVGSGVGSGVADGDGVGLGSSALGLTAAGGSPVPDGVGDAPAAQLLRTTMERTAAEIALGRRWDPSRPDLKISTPHPTGGALRRDCGKRKDPGGGTPPGSGHQEDLVGFAVRRSRRGRRLTRRPHRSCRSCHRRCRRSPRRGRSTPNPRTGTT